MHNALSKSLRFVALSGLVVACGNRTELLEPPWGEPDGGGQAGTAGAGGASGAGGATGHGGASGAGGSLAANVCESFCSKCGHLISNCSAQCADAKIQVGVGCQDLFAEYLQCAGDNGCNENSCPADAIDLAKCIDLAGPDAGF